MKAVLCQALALIVISAAVSAHAAQQTTDFNQVYSGDSYTRLLLHFEDDTFPPQDSSDFNNHANLAGGSTISSDGKFGQAVLMDGDWDFLKLGNDSSLSPVDKLTFEAWVKPFYVRWYS